MRAACTFVSHKIHYRIRVPDVTEVTNFSEKTSRQKENGKSAREHRELCPFLDEKMLRNVHTIIMGKYS